MRASDFLGSALASWPRPRR